MPKFIPFDEVKDRVPIEKAIDLLNLTMKQSNNQYRGECPVCEKGGDRALCITPSKGKWYCFGCQEGGDVIALTAKVRQCSMREAAFFLAGDQVPEERRKQPEPSEGFAPLEYLQPDHEAVEAVGFCPKFSSEVGLGYAPRGLHRGLVAVPIRTADGTLRGYIGISEAKLPKDFQPS